MDLDTQWSLEQIRTEIEDIAMLIALAIGFVVGVFLK